MSTSFGELAVTIPAPLTSVHLPAAPVQRRHGRSADAGLPPLIRITGALADDAEWRVTLGSRPVGMVIVLIDQPGAVQIRGAHIVGSDPLAMMAGEAKAHALRRGAVVTVHGSLLAPHPSGRSIEMLGITDVVIAHPPVARHEPQEARP